MAMRIHTKFISSFSDLCAIFYRFLKFARISGLKRKFKNEIKKLSSG
jgi:hypothetical protein